MTLAEFKASTSGMPDSCQLHVLSPWGAMEPAAFVVLDDLEDNDPIREAFPPNAILFTGEAN